MLAQVNHSQAWKPEQAPHIVLVIYSVSQKITRVLLQNLLREFQWVLRGVVISPIGQAEAELTARISKEVRLNGMI